MENLYELLEEAAHKVPTKGIVIVNNSQCDLFLTYSELREKSRKIAFILKSYYQVKPVSKIIISVEKSENFILLFWGCVMAGCIPVLMPSVQFSNKNSIAFERLKNAIDILGVVTLITNDINLFEYYKSSFHKAVCVEDIMKQLDLLQDYSLHIPKRDSKDLCVIQFSSGSTGAPKGVMLSFNNILTNLKIKTLADEITTEDTLIHWMPYFHDYGLFGNHLVCLYNINPTTMQKTGEIDLSEYAIGKESGDKNPEPGASVIRDGILYVGLAQDKSQFNPNTGAYVLLIDTKTDKPIKMISDNRATMATAYEYSGDPFIDEKGDLYIYCVGGFGYFANCTEGFLRIKKGETDFDQSYYFPIETISIPDIKGNKANYIYSKTYTGNGKLYGYFNVPGYISNPPDYVNDKSMQTFEIDVYNKTVKKMNFDGTTGWSCSQCKAGDYMVFGMASTQGTGYYLYNYKEDKYEPLKIKTEGNPFKIQYLK